MKAATLFIFSLLFLSACAPASVQPLETFTPQASKPPTPTLLPQPSSTPLSVFVTPFPTQVVTPIPSPTANSAGLIILKQEIEDLKTAPLSFTTMDGQEFDTAALQEGSQIANATGQGLATEYKGSLLTAEQNYNHDNSQGWVTVQQNGRAIYQTYTGPASPIYSLRGLHSLAPCATCPRHWMLETTLIERKSHNGAIDDQGIGQLVEDGTSINKEYGYQAAFNFQTLNGKPFYFFQRIPSLKSTSTIDAWYNGQIVPLGYDEIPHYGCGDASALNPRGWANRLVFFARSGQTWYFVQIGVP